MQNCTHGSMKAAGLLALRLSTALIFIYMGVMKVGMNHEMASGMFASMSLPGSGSMWAYLIGGLEILAGAMVALGIFARYAGALLSIIMVVALLTIHRGGPLMGAFLPISLLGASLAIALGGAGKWRAVKCECCCKACKLSYSDMKKDGCCGGNCGGCEDKK